MFTLTASGSVSDYSDTSSLQQAFATAAGVDPSAVHISLAPGSVIITATIAVPAGNTAAAVTSSLSFYLGTASAASTALGIAVEAPPTVMTASHVPPPLHPPSPPLPPLAPGERMLPVVVQSMLVSTAIDDVNQAAYARSMAGAFSGVAAADIKVS